MVSNHCVSSNRDQETIITLHGPCNSHLKLVFVLQNDPLNLSEGKNASLPEQLTPLPVYPASHTQEKDPSVFVQVALL